MTQPTQTWQQAILAHFTPKRERMLLVIDPDNLLRDDVLLAEIQNRNYDVLELVDEVSFRAAFERNYRSRWDDGEARHVVVVVHTTDGERHIPYDLRCKSKHVELSVSALFSNLNAIVVSQLDNAYYADLYPAHRQLVERGEMLRLERQTVEFILRVVFGLEPLGASDPARWVEFLIHKHYGARELPPALETYMVQKLLPGVSAAGLRAEFLEDAAAFYAWLGDRWAAYVAATAGAGMGASSAAPPVDVDLGDPRLRPLLGHLFTEGLIPRASAPAAALTLQQRWMAVGLPPAPGSAAGVGVRESAGDLPGLLYTLRARLQRFQALDAAALPQGKTDLRDWLNLAAEWAEAVYQANTLPLELYREIRQDLAAARLALDAHFWDFIQNRYSAVDHYQDNRGPISLVALNRWLREQVGDAERLALLCFDGLALDQWLLLRDYLCQVLPGLAFRENRTYAVAPPVTCVSRQALFAGRMPAAFAETITRTDKDAERWLAHWVHHDVPKPRVAHAAVQVNGRGLDTVRAVVEGKNQRLGLLTNLFDTVMHGIGGMDADADKRVYYAALRAHLENGHLSELFVLLLEQGYRIFVTADHGNIAGVGIGLRPPKDLIDGHASRVVLFDQPSLAQEYAGAHGLRVLHTKSLPPGVHPVYLPANSLFASAGATAIAHGGLSLEELVVPFVEVLRE